MCAYLNRNYHFGKEYLEIFNFKISSLQLKSMFRKIKIDLKLIIISNRLFVLIYPRFFIFLYLTIAEIIFFTYIFLNLYQILHSGNTSIYWLSVSILFLLKVLLIFKELN